MERLRPFRALLAWGLALHGQLHALAGVPRGTGAGHVALAAALGLGAGALSANRFHAAALGALILFDWTATIPLLGAALGAFLVGLFARRFLAKRPAPASGLTALIELHELGERLGLARNPLAREACTADHVEGRRLCRTGERRLKQHIALALGAALVLGAWALWAWPRYVVSPAYLVLPSSLDRRRILLGYVALLGAGFLVLELAGIARAIARCERTRRQLVLLDLALLGAPALVLAVLEGVAGLVVPPWPARELRPIAVRLSDSNSWGMRDEERTVAKPAGKKRVLFVGDSMLEGAYCKAPLPRLCQAALANTECVNLGVSATGPPHYLWRIRTVGDALAPDAVLVFFSAGTDWMSGNAQAAPWKLLDERPLPSALGSVAPRLTWLSVRALGLSEFRPAGTDDDGRFLEELRGRPFEAALPALAAYGSKRTGLSPERVETIFRKGGARLWEALAPRAEDEEHLQPWIVLGLLQGEESFERDSSQAAKQWDVEATASWFQTMSEDARARGVPFSVVLCPEALQVDAEAYEAWAPWPSVVRFKPAIDSSYEELLRALDARGVRRLDLKPTLAGQRGTYRKTDRHWTEKGHALVRAPVVAEIEKLLSGKP